MRSYSPGEVSIIVGTVIVEDWESVTVAPDEDQNTFDVGADGEVSATENANKLATITIVTKQVSASNTTLSALALTNAVTPVTIKDNSGTSLHVAPRCKFLKLPEVSYQKTVQDRTWTLKGKLDVHLVGQGGE